MKKMVSTLIMSLITFSILSGCISGVRVRMVTADTLESNMPVVFVDPQNVIADVGDSFTVSVKVFNLSAQFYIADAAWQVGDPLPGPGGRYNYSMGYLYGLDIKLSWDPTLLEYVSHTVEVPVETHAGGILHQPIVDVLDSVDAAAGTYRIAKSSQLPALSFNSPNANATVFMMTFSVKKGGKCALNLENTDLAADKSKMPNIQPEIPHWIKSGQFSTGNLMTRIEGVNAGALVQGTLYDPVISGEDATVQITVKNENDTTTCTYNLTLYNGTTILNKWEGRTLDPDENETFSYTITSPSMGTHTVEANASIQQGSYLFTDEVSQNFTVIGTPALVIEGPDSATGGQTVTFDAATSAHSDPNSHITNYMWTFWAPGETLPRSTVNNATSATFTLPSAAKVGNWTVMLVVTDSNGITAQPVSGTMLKPDSELLRPAAASYRITHILEVHGPPPQISIIWPENKSYSVNNVQLIFALDKPVVWMGYSLDGQANATISGNTTLLILAEGMHRITVYANDTSGSMGRSDTIYFTVLDFTPPSITILSPENKTYGEASVPLTFLVNEPVSHVLYSLDGHSNITLTGSATLSNLSEGSHSLVVYAEDTAGNVGSLARYFTVHTQPELDYTLIIIVAAVALVALLAIGSSIYLKRLRKPQKSSDV